MSLAQSNRILENLKDSFYFVLFIHSTEVFCLVVQIQFLMNGFYLLCSNE